MKRLIEQLTQILDESLQEPGLLKAVFLAGGTGSGKSTVVNELFRIADGPLGEKLSFSVTGMKLVDMDQQFKRLLRKAYIDPADLNRLAKEDPKKYAQSEKARNKAWMQSQKLQDIYLKQRLGVIVDGTGRARDYTMGHVEKAESLGYDTMMVLVSVPLDVALERNRMRGRKGGRMVPENIVKDIHNQVQDNVAFYKKHFGRNFVEVVNTNPRAITREINRAVRDFIAKPVKNPIGKKWIEAEKARRGVTSWERQKENPELWKDEE